ncbi:PHP domain-containing protein, partial [Acidimicrobiaceae bacterium]|nr:PHP domain-containing protein [Acidimicrobiaceae bacterium]
MSIDLHTHSINSDGTLYPKEILKLATELQLEAISITDHEYLTEIDYHANLKVISGIEVSVNWEHLEERNKYAGVHLLVYYISKSDPLNMKLEEVRKQKIERNYKVLENLRNIDINIENSELDLFETKVPGRPHIAKLMVEKKYVSSMNEAFLKYLGNGKIENLNSHQINIKEVINLAKESKSLVFLAHPHTLMSNNNSSKRSNWVNSQFYDYLQKLKSFGLDGVEVYYPGYNQSTKDNLLDLLSELDLMASGGSDFHG